MIEPTQSIKRVKASTLNNIEINYFPCSNTINKSKDPPLLMVVGGIHGNEPQCIKGAELVRDYFKNTVVHILAEEILKRVSIVVIPCINKIGALAGARCCPTLMTMFKNEKIANKTQNSDGFDGDLEVNYCVNTCKVIVPEDETRSLKVPYGWQDPNRGWDENDTFVKHHLEKLFGHSQGEHRSTFFPDMVIFNHDWAIVQGKSKIYARSEEIKKSIHTMISKGITTLYSRVYPAKKIFGTPWNFVIMAGEKDEQEKDSENQKSPDQENMTWKLSEKYGITSYVIENYFGDSDISPKLHLALDLFLLAKHAGLGDGDIIASPGWKDQQLLKILIDENKL